MAGPTRNPAAATPKVQAAKGESKATGEKLSSISTIQAMVLIANQHTAPIILPRSMTQGEQKIALPPMILHPGVVTPVDGIEWAIRKQLEVIQHYLDRGLIAEVNQLGSCPVLDQTSTNLQDCIPDNLKSESEQGDVASAEVKKAQVGNVNI